MRVALRGGDEIVGVEAGGLALDQDSDGVEQLEGRDVLCEPGAQPLIAQHLSPFVRRNGLRPANVVQNIESDGVRGHDGDWAVEVPVYRSPDY